MHGHFITTMVAAAASAALFAPVSTSGGRFKYMPVDGLVITNIFISLLLILSSTSHNNWEVLPFLNSWRFLGFPLNKNNPCESCTFSPSPFQSTIGAVSVLIRADFTSTRSSSRAVGSFMLCGGWGQVGKGGAVALLRLHAEAVMGNNTRYPYSVRSMLTRCPRRPVLMSTKVSASWWPTT